MMTPERLALMLFHFDGDEKFALTNKDVELLRKIQQELAMCEKLEVAVSFEPAATPEQRTRGLALARRDLERKGCHSISEPVECDGVSVITGFQSPAAANLVEQIKFWQGEAVRYATELHEIRQVAPA